MKNGIFLSFVLVAIFQFFPSNSHGEWERLLGTSSYEYAYGIVVDSSGNSYITGETKGDLDGHLNAGEEDLFLLKYDSNGNKIWSKLYGTADCDTGKDVAVDSEENIYVVGYSGNRTGDISTISLDVLIVKYDNNGNELWSKTLGISGCPWRQAGIDIDSVGNFYITGTTSDSDAFIAKYDADGNQSWVRYLATSNDEAGEDIAVDSLGNSYITGVSFGNLGGNVNLGDSSGFIAKYDSNGNWLWVNLISSANFDYAKSIDIDEYGNSYLTGYTRGDLDGNVNSGYFDIFIVKYDTNGNKIWSKLLGTSESDMGQGIAVDSFGNFYVTGETQGNLDGILNVAYEGTFVVKYDTNGIKKGTRLQTITNDNEGGGIATDLIGNVYVAGGSWGDLAEIPNSGGQDILIWSLTISDSKEEPVKALPYIPLLLLGG